MPPDSRMPGIQKAGSGGVHPEFPDVLEYLECLDGLKYLQAQEFQAF